MVFFVFVFFTVSGYWLLNPKLIKVLDLANSPGALWTIAASHWWLVLVGKEPTAFTVNLARSGAVRMEGTEAMEEASFSGVVSPVHLQGTRVSFVGLH